MRDDTLLSILDDATVDPSVIQLRPDYRVMLVGAAGVELEAAQALSEPLLSSADTFGRELLATQPVEGIPHVEAWREAYRSFGAKPQRTRNSLEALLRRATSGLPRVNPLTDLYNAISVRHLAPVGGEDLHHYQGAPRLIRSLGTEPFDTVANGLDVIEHPDPGEVVWCDDAGVTCRRWNWRQARRTQLSEATTAALFIIDALAPMTDTALQQAADDLVTALQASGAQVVTRTRLISHHASDEGR